MHTEPTIDASNDAEAWPSTSVGSQRPLREELLDLASLEFRVVRSGAAAKRLKINSSRCTLGSGEGCTIRLNDPTLRSMHAVILRDSNRVLLRAYTVPIEINGSLVNEQFLQLGDTFRLGAYLFELVDGPQLIDQELRSSSSGSMGTASELSSEWDELATHEYPLRNRPTPISIDETDRPLSVATKTPALNRPRLSFAGSSQTPLESLGEAVGDVTTVSGRLQIAQRAAQRQESEELRREIEAWRRRESRWQEDQIQIRAELADAVSRFNDSQQQAQQAADAVSQMRARLNEITHEFQTLSKQYEVSLADNAQQQAMLRTSLAKLESDCAQAEEGKEAAIAKLRLEEQARRKAEALVESNQAKLDELEAARTQATFEKDRAVADSMRLIAERDEAAKERTALQQSITQSNHRIEALAKELESASVRLQSARREVTEAYDKISTLTAQIKKADQRAAVAEQLAAEHARTLDEVQKRNVQLSAQVASQSDSREQERKSWEDEAAQLQLAIQQLSLELASANGKLSVANDEQDATRTELNAAYERLTATRRELSEAMQRPTLEAFESLQEQLADKAERTNQVSSLQATLEEALKRPTLAQYEDVQRRLSVTEEELRAARQSLDELQKQASQHVPQVAEPAATESISLTESQWLKPSSSYDVKPSTTDSTLNDSTSVSQSTWNNWSKPTVRNDQTASNDRTVVADLSSVAAPKSDDAITTTSQWNTPIGTSTPELSSIKEDSLPQDASPEPEANAYDWPTYQVEAEPVPSMSPPAAPIKREEPAINWADRLAMLRREMLEEDSDNGTSDEPGPEVAGSSWYQHSSTDVTTDAASDEAGEDVYSDQELDENNSVSARLESFTARDHESHYASVPESRPHDDEPSQQEPRDYRVADAMKSAQESELIASSGQDLSAESTSRSWGTPVDASTPDNTVDTNESPHASADEPTLGSLAKQLIAELSQSEPASDLNHTQKNVSVDEIEDGRSIGSWMASSTVWGRIEDEDQDKSLPTNQKASSWRNAEEAVEDASLDDHPDNLKDDGEDDGTMMLSDWPSKQSLEGVKAGYLDNDGEVASAYDRHEPESTRQFEFQSQRYEVEEAEPAQPNRPSSNFAPSSPASNKATDEEDSIEDYMNRLLQRVQGGTTTATLTSSTNAAPVTESVTTSRYSTNYSSPVSQTATVSTPIDIIDPNTPIIPRSQAPEDANNLAAMRELANATAKSAITNSVRGQANQLKSRAVMDLMQAGVVLVCGFAFYIAGLRLTHLRMVWFTAATLAVALSVFFVFDMFKKLAAARNAYERASHGEQSED